MKDKETLAEELAKLKEKYSTVYSLEVPLNEDGSTATVFLRKLDRDTFKVINKLVQRDELMATEAMLKSLYIGGDDLKAITDDFEVLRSASVSVGEIIKVREGILKKN